MSLQKFINIKNLAKLNYFKLDIKWTYLFFMIIYIELLLL
jgi:hypothetical protein